MESWVAYSLLPLIFGTMFECRKINQKDSYNSIRSYRYIKHYTEYKQNDHTLSTSMQWQSEVRYVSGNTISYME